MIRLVLVALFVFLFLVLSIPVLIVEWLIGKRNPGLRDRSSKAIIKWAFRWILVLTGVKLIVRGKENIPSDSAVLFVGNHRSYFDILITYVNFPGVTGFVAKKEMLRYPLLRDWMKNIHCLFLDRDDIKQGLKTILKGVEEVKNGVSMCIFPEGTRNKVNDTFLPFREGSFKIAEKGGVPVVPMTILNAAAIFEDHLPKVKRATVILQFEEPIYPAEMDKALRKNLGSHVSNLISEKYFRLKEEYMP
ncbi:1-acylglycerol-3-phosphate O-acyltransferase [Acetatifactor muris]|uniref:1-acyl-sn-glycerol-3-phosphate acyltransferase n=1 Tax=Acetatifactor muris TaxID=879566 RepID=A0A2K4ZJS6_9FIRM|nr:lysophospholipid acyltransferase family protein [Acetatifactor muris]MCR2049115.1 1-acylglycerol-3-phosphate O-acyltransferase [Acetatifactor muris]SOY30737.1 1-acyl-sn-glycerol-3-phosphate acyltransferase [Acetatifactor muris]